MDALFDTELWDENIESSVKNANNLCLTNDRTILLSKVGDEEAEEEMIGLFLRQLGVPLFAATGCQ